MPNWLIDPPTPLVCDPVTNAGFGSWRCASDHSMRELLQAWPTCLAEAEPFGELLTHTGIRTFEALRLHPHQLSEDGTQLAIKGKDNVHHTAHRSIPVPVFLQAPLVRLATTNSNYLFQRVDGDPFTVAELESRLYDGLRYRPDLYSLRHAYRSSHLLLGIPIQATNYLLGHQSEGCCLFDPYLNHPYVDLAHIAQKLTSHIQEKVSRA